ncbi:ParB/RepB/Spo0J family partition protein [Streptomyces sp. NPDC023838]|uniref:ParB/RepB/Spo0J family partition protein n=1 Tax=Streptomyces sp. NPDC023838 TaxID=3154325 RepID=UPI0033F7CCE4
MSKAKDLGAGSSFGQARPVSARRAAIGAVTVAPTAGVPDPTELPVGRISQNPDNPREQLRDLDGLADSIREIGLINAITVASVEAYLRERPDRAADLDPDTRYIVIDGHRRLAAAKLAGAPTVRVSVDNALVSTDEALLEAAFVANVHRDDMNPLEQANALKKLVEFYGSQNRAAKRLGIAQSTISSKLSVLDLTPELQADLVEGRRKVEHVRNLSKYTADQQREQADARAAAADERREAARRATELSRRDNPSATTDPTPHDSTPYESTPYDSTPYESTPYESTSAVVALARGEKVELYPRTEPDDAADLSRRDNPTKEHDLSRRDSSKAATDSGRGPATGGAPDLSRRDNPIPSHGTGNGNDLPAPRPEANSGPGARPVVKMPWNDGVACAEIAISRMTSTERHRMLERLQEEAAREADTTQSASAG